MIDAPDLAKRATRATIGDIEQVNEAIIDYKGTVPATLADIHRELVKVAEDTRAFIEIYASTFEKITPENMMTMDIQPLFDARDKLLATLGQLFDVRDVWVDAHTRPGKTEGSAGAH